MSGSSATLANQIDPTVVFGFTNLPDNREREPLRIVRGRGVFIYDEKGKDYIEGASSFYCTSLGFSEEALIEAAAEQMRQLPFYVTAAHRSVPVVEQLAERLAALVPMKNAKVAFAATGSEANDALIKFLWYHNNAVGKTRRKKVIGRLGSYHGGTIATASLTGWVKYHAGFDLPMDGILHTEQPDYLQLGEPGESEETFADRMIADLRTLIEREDPETIGAFFAEPVSVSAGLALPPRTYWEKLGALLKEYEIRLFDDEVVTGFGRTGNMFGAETYDMAPDCMTVAKALTSAYQPLSAVIMGEEFYEGLERGSAEVGMFSHAGTYHGHPVPAAVALRVLELMQERDILGHVRSVSPHFAAALRALEDHPLVSGSRAVGLAGAVDLAMPEIEAGALGALVAACCETNGLFIRPVGDTIVCAPPLIITQAEIDEMFRRLRRALDDGLEGTPQLG
ncbi:MAG: aminotransferase [Alphaproteobacteria bacterium]|jgi:4-aminobutyrate--pyruvate transaminase|nr:aminotransferase [Alphaproteobacteria bacterium]